MVNACRNVKECIRGSIDIETRIASKQTLSNQTHNLRHTATETALIPIKRYFVCKNVSCWSSKHPDQERSKATEEFKTKMRNRGTPFNFVKTRLYNTEFDGEHINNKENNENNEAQSIEVMIAEMI
ncbi:hypothetical protein OnM2_063025 [Erysiphe neolycopersici]|uniref:Uncharacterized protein n=1 Tax=Erysiphe neolycopersici TaxID=212602 RepID=A0A420HNN2_9PEZI|nr:hypothetical protein OnM2_063025 [Erysiphe neolycopersici]